jgi:N utilization substance protein B
VFLLYQHDLTGLTLDELTENANRAGDPIDEFTLALIEGVSVDRAHLDRLISQESTGWTAERIAPLERNILRVAIHEILDWSDIPVAVSISEAVELAKRFCQPDAAGLVNGVLGSIARSAPSDEGEAVE